jgi:hypothetical protein
VPFTLNDIANAQQHSPLRRSSTLKYWNVVLKYFDLPQRGSSKRVSSPLPSQPARNDQPELFKHLASANRGLQLLKERNVHIAYSITRTVSEAVIPQSTGLCEVSETDSGKAEHGQITEVTKLISFHKRFTVPTRSDLTIEGLESTTESASQDEFRERQIKVCIFTASLLVQQANSSSLRIPLPASIDRIQRICVSLIHDFRPTPS